MRQPAPAFRILQLFLASTLVASGCTLSPEHNSPDRVQIPSRDLNKGVHALLDRWVSAFESRDLKAVRSILTEDDRFVWLEDGQARYPNSDAVIAALASFPQELAFEYRLSDVRIIPISENAAWAHMITHTEIRRNNAVVSQFAGVVSMLVQQQHGQWRIVAAHTSNTTRSQR